MVCPKCGAPVGREDEYCKSCGYPVSSGSAKGGKKKTPIYLLALIVLVEIAVIGAVIGLLLLKSPEDNDSAETTTTVEKTEVKDSEKKDTTKNDTEKNNTKKKETKENTKEDTKSEADEDEAEKEKEADEAAKAKEEAKAKKEAEAEKAAEPEPEPEPEAGPEPEPEPAPAQNVRTSEAFLLTDQNSVANIRATYQKLTTNKVINSIASTTIQQSEVQNPPINMLDDDPMTNWQEGANGSGLGEYTDFTFDQKYNLTALTFRLGNWKTDRYFYGNNRPKTLRIETSDNVWTITFPDEWKECAVQFSPPVSTDKLRFTIEDVYRGSDWDDTVITDACVWYQ